MKFTDFITPNPTKNPEPEKNVEAEFVINAIAQPATVNVPKGGIFNQSDGANTPNETNMHDTLSLIDTRRHQTSKSQIVPITVPNSHILMQISTT